MSATKSANNSNANFNKQFITNIKKTQAEENAHEEQKLESLNKKNEVYNYSLYSIIIGINDTFFGMLNDIMTRNIHRDFFTKDNRMFYIGVFFVLVALVMLIYNHIYSIHFDDVLKEIKNHKENNGKITYVYNIYNDEILDNVPTKSSSIKKHVTNIKKNAPHHHALNNKPTNSLKHKILPTNTKPSTIKKHSVPPIKKQMYH